VNEFESRYARQLAFPIGIGETGNPYVTITGPGVDKGTALRRVCEHLSVPLEETMAMGDAMPDAAMFEVAGVAVAMGNGSHELKELADAVAPSNSEGGVAWAIRRYVLEVE
jgi:hydroxymethylpyrimidine pyrophosphatase-like HAD family hydrolase